MQESVQNVEQALSRAEIDSMVVEEKLNRLRHILKNSGLWISSADTEAVVQKIKEELDLHGLIHNALIYGRLKKIGAASRMKCYKKKQENEPGVIAKYKKEYYEKNKSKILASQKAYVERRKKRLKDEILTKEKIATCVVHQS